MHMAARHQCTCTWQVYILKYDDVLRRPLEVVKEVHHMLGVYTSTPKLTAFVIGLLLGLGIGIGVALGVYTSTPKLTAFVRTRLRPVPRVGVRVRFVLVTLGVGMWVRVRARVHAQPQ